MKNNEKKANLPFVPKGSKRAMLALFVALIMTATVFVPVIGSGEETGELSTYIVHGDVKDTYGLPVLFANITAVNTDTGDILNSTVEDGSYSIDLAEMENGVHIGDRIEITVADGISSSTYNFTVDDAGEKTLDIQLDYVDSSFPPLPDPVLPEIPDIPEPEIPPEFEEPSPPVANLTPENPGEENNSAGNNETNETEPAITLYDIRCPPYFRLAFTEKKNRLQLTLKNLDTARHVVKADLYEINPDGVSTFLKTIHYGNINPDDTKTKHTWWSPETAGKNWIYGEIYIKERNGCDWTLANTFKEDFNTVPGWRPVMEIDGDWVIDEPTNISNKTIIVHGDVYVNAPGTFADGTLIAGNFTVNDTRIIYPGFDVDLQASYNGEFHTEITPTGTLILYDWIHNTPSNVYYNFWMNGTLIVDKNQTLPSAEPGKISEVNGDPDDLSKPGGIIADNAVGKVRIVNGGTIYHCASHALWLNTTIAEIDEAVINNTGGDGIHVENLDTTGIINTYGKPDYTPGTDLGYFIWWDDSEWHIVWSSNGTETHFNGTVSYEETSLGINATETYSGGMDIPISSSTFSLTFDLWINGERRKEKVFIGKYSEHPSDIPFTLYAVNLEDLGIKNSIISNNARFGVSLYHSSNIPIENNNLSDNGGYGIYLYSSDNNLISDNTASNNKGGIYLRNSNNNIVSNNPVLSNYWNDILLIGSSNNIITNNTALLSPYNGIHLKDGSDSNTINDNTVSNNDYGIYLSFSSSNTITNNTANSNTWYGIHLYYSDSNTIINNTASNSWEGIYLGGTSSSNTIANNNASNNNYGIYLYYSNSNTIENNNASSNNRNGILLSHSSSSTITNNTVNSNSWASIYIHYSSSNTITNNTVNSNNGNGIVLYSSSSNTIINSTVSNNRNGIVLQSSNYNIIINSTVASNTHYGISLSSSTSNKIINENKVSKSICGIYLYQSDNTNLIEDNILKENDYGIYLNLSDENILHHNTVNNNTHYGIFLLSSTGNTISENNASLNNEYGIHLYNSSDNTITDNTASSNTYCGISLIHSNNNTITNNTVSSNEDYGILLSSSYNNKIIEENKVSKSTCGIYLYQSNRNLVEDSVLKENDYGIYLNLSVNNTILSNSITGYYEGEYKGTGIYLKYSDNNSVSHNVVGAPSRRMSRGIYVYSSDHCNISDNTISFTLAGLYLYFSNHSTIYHSTVTENEYSGIYLYSSNHNDITGNTASWNVGVYGGGIYLKVSSYNNISDNTLRRNFNDGIRILSSSNNMVEGNTILQNGDWGAREKSGIALTSSANNTLRNNTVYDNNVCGIKLRYSMNNIIFNNTATNNRHGIYLYQSDDNTITNSNASSNNRYGIYLGYSNHNTINNTNVFSNTYDGIHIETSLDNELDSNTIVSNDNGVYIHDSSVTLRQNNIIEENENRGIYVDNEGNYSLSIVIANNTIKDNNGGIFIFNASFEITGNEVTSNGDTGIYIEKGTGKIYKKNTITYNQNVGGGVPPWEVFTGIDIRSSSDILISNNTLLKNTENIYVAGSTNITIEWNKITDETAVPQVYPYPPTPTGIHISSSQAKINNNIIFGTCVGMKIEQAGPETLIADNKLYSATDNGIRLWNASPTIKGNLLNGSTQGIFMEEGSEPVISDNEITNCSAGIYSRGANPTINGNNIIKYNDYGIYCLGSNATIENNEITDNKYDGIYIEGSDEYGYFRPYIAGNNISANGAWGIEARYEAPLNNQTINEDNIWTVDNTNGRFVQKWRIRVYVTLDGNPQANATVWVVDLIETEVWRGTTDENGYTPWITLTEYFIDNNDTHFRTPHTIYAEYGNYRGTTTQDVNRNIPQVEVKLKAI